MRIFFLTSLCDKKFLYLREGAVMQLFFEKDWWQS